MPERESLAEQTKRFKGQQRAGKTHTKKVMDRKNKIEKGHEK